MLHLQLLLQQQLERKHLASSSVNITWCSWPCVPNNSNQSPIAQSWVKATFQIQVDLQLRSASVKFNLYLFNFAKQRLNARSARQKCVEDRDRQMMSGIVDQRRSHGQDSRPLWVDQNLCPAHRWSIGHLSQPEAFTWLLIFSDSEVYSKGHNYLPKPWNKKNFRV